MIFVEFGDPSCISLWDIVRKTDIQMAVNTSATAVDVGNYED